MLQPCGIVLLNSEARIEIKGIAFMKSMFPMKRDVDSMFDCKHFSEKLKNLVPHSVRGMVLVELK